MGCRSYCKRESKFMKLKNQSKKKKELFSISQRCKWRPSLFLQTWKISAAETFASHLRQGHFPKKALATKPFESKVANMVAESSAEL